MTEAEKDKAFLKNVLISILFFVAMAAIVVGVVIGSGLENSSNLQWAKGMIDSVCYQRGYTDKNGKTIIVGGEVSAASATNSELAEDFDGNSTNWGSDYAKEKFETKDRLILLVARNIISGDNAKQKTFYREEAEGSSTIYYAYFEIENKTLTFNLLTVSNGQSTTDVLVITDNGDDAWTMEMASYIGSSSLSTQELVENVCYYRVEFDGETTARTVFQSYIPKDGDLAFTTVSADNIASLYFLDCDLSAHKRVCVDFNVSESDQENLPCTNAQAETLVREFVTNYNSLKREVVTFDEELSLSTDSNFMTETNKELYGA
jgi:hypothetical protein